MLKNNAYRNKLLKMASKVENPEASSETERPTSPGFKIGSTNKVSPLLSENPENSAPPPAYLERTLTEDPSTIEAPPKPPDYSAAVKTVIADGQNQNQNQNENQSATTETNKTSTDAAATTSDAPKTGEVLSFTEKSIRLAFIRKVYGMMNCNL